MKPKKMVRYKTSKVMGENQKYKETFAISITGPVAKVLIDAHKRHESLLWHYSLKDQRIDLWHSELVE